MLPGSVQHFDTGIKSLFYVNVKCKGEVFESQEKQAIFVDAGA